MVVQAFEYEKEHLQPTDKAGDKLCIGLSRIGKVFCSFDVEMQVGKPDPLNNSVPDGPESKLPTVCEEPLRRFFVS